MHKQNMHFCIAATDWGPGMQKTHAYGPDCAPWYTMNMDHKNLCKNNGLKIQTPALAVGGSSRSSRSMGAALRRTVRSMFLNSSCSGQPWAGPLRRPAGAGQLAEPIAEPQLWLAKPKLQHSRAKRGLGHWPSPSSSTVDWHHWLGPP